MASVFTDINDIPYTIDLSGDIIESSYSNIISKNRIKKIFIGSNVTMISNRLFHTIETLDEVEFDISCNIQIFGKQVFETCSHLKNVYNIPNVAVSMGVSTFVECSNLETVTFSPTF